MSNDKTAVGLGVPFLIFIFLTWLNAGVLNWYFSLSIPWIFTHIGGVWIVVGCLFLIPVFILTIVFMVSSEDTSEKVGFGLALPAWFLILIGTIIGLYYETSDFVSPALFFIFVLPQVVLGFGLYARRNYRTQMLAQQPPQPRYNYRPSQPIRQPIPPPNRGRSVISDEVRLASTYGQTIKNCVRCNSTLDIRTQVCYFCGSRQPQINVRALESQTLPPPEPLTSPQAPAPRPRTVEEFNFCPNCGGRVIKGHLFCTTCGASLD
jgi:hypothetical protein